MIQSEVRSKICTGAENRGQLNVLQVIVTDDHGLTAAFFMSPPIFSPERLPAAGRELKD
jgi:hypothetical protein